MKAGTCEHCGIPIRQPKTGRRRRYCETKWCKQARRRVRAQCGTKKKVA